MYRIIQVFILWLFSFPMMTFAAQVNLYQVAIPVNTQSETERAGAIKKGVEQVLAKLTGNAAIAQQSAIKPKLTNAANYVQEYRYLPSPANDGRYDLQIFYTKNDLNELLDEADIPFWGDQRPLIIMWVAMTDSQGTTTIISEESQKKLMAQLKETARILGIPVVFPVMDTADLSLISEKDIKTPDLSILKEASKRYSPDAYMIVTIQQEEGRYTSQWQLMLQDKHWDWPVTNKSIDKLANTALDHAAQILVKQYSEGQHDQPKQWIKLEVSQMTSAADVSKLMKSLKQISLVRRIQLDQVSGDRVQLSLMVQGPMEKFIQNAAINKHLVLSSSQDSTLIYQWVQ
jgi:hypothetical protein